MNILSRVPLKAFSAKLKDLVKPGYTKAMWPIGGFFLIYIALTALLAYVDLSFVSTLYMNLMMLMYGMASTSGILLALAELLGAFALIIALGFWFSFITTAVTFTYQDRLQNPDVAVSPSSIWQNFKHLRKNQLWRISLYAGLYIFLWTLPLTIVGSLVAKYTWAVLIVRVLNYLIVLWKSYEYSQAVLLYREKQPSFLGQSMRHALTASRRFMGGLKINWFLLQLVLVALPILVWSAIFGAVAYYGIYTATYFFMYFGYALIVLGITAYLPVIFASSALFYEEAKKQIKVDEDFNGLFKPVEELTGEAYRN
jgi:hypothetical protein